MKRSTLTHYLLLVFAGTLLFLSSCQKDIEEQSGTLAKDHDSKVYLRWNDLFMDIDRYAGGYRPGPGPRALAYMSLSAYESVVAGIPENNSLRHMYVGLNIPQPNPDQEYYWPACVNESYAFLMQRFFYYLEISRPDLVAKIEQTRQQMRSEFLNKTTPEILERSEAYGRAVAQAVYDWENTDPAGHEAFLNASPSNYIPPQGPGFWQPTFPDYGTALFPYWGQVRTFAMKQSELLGKPPIPYSEDETSLFWNQAAEAFFMVNTIKSNGPNAHEMRWIGEFWSDDNLGVTFSPPTRLVAVANQVVDNEDLDLATAAELYAKICLALSDASVAVWHSKYVYNVERPISYIRRVMSAKYPEAANWSTILNDPISGYYGMTPSFPAYPSGHSGFAGAGGKILSSMFEYNDTHVGTYVFTDNCHMFRSEFNGTPRTFASFADLAKEDAYSRVPLGVHFRMDCDEGIRLGELAAQRVLELPWKK